MGLSGWFLVCPLEVAARNGLVATDPTAAGDHSTWLRLDFPAPPEIQVSGPCISGLVFDSDWCYVEAADAERPAWSWLFGEAGMPVAASEPLDAPQTASAVVEWCRTVGIAVPDAGDVRDALQEESVFAEEGFFALLDLLGLAETPVERDVVDGTHMRASDLNEIQQFPPGDRAIALDHHSPAWADFVSRLDLEDFGDPAAVFVLDGGHAFLACEPPVSVGFWMGDLDFAAQQCGGVGDWMGIPPNAARTVDAAAAWVRQNIGRQGRPPSADRPPLNFELSLSGGHPHEIANTEHLYLRLRSDADLDGVAGALAEWMDVVRAALVAPVVRRYPADLVLTKIDPHAFIEGPPEGLIVTTSGWTPKTRARFGAGDDAGWARKKNELLKGTLRSLTLELLALNLAGSRSFRRGTIEVTVNIDPAFDFSQPREDRPVRASVFAASRLLSHVEDPIEHLAGLARQVLAVVAAVDPHADAVLSTWRGMDNPEVILQRLTAD